MHQFRQPLLGISLAWLLANSAAAFTIGPPVAIGSITHADLPEVSGIADSRTNPGVFWVHNDSGHPPEFFAIGHDGARLGEFPLAGAPFGDWEDIAVSPKAGGGSYLYLGDIGDNDTVRPFITVYRTVEPSSTASATIAQSDYAAAQFQYPNGKRNAEALIVDPLTGEITIITKTSTPEIYSAPATVFESAATTTLTARGVVNSSLSTATAADISPDGRFILLRSKTVGTMFQRAVGQSVADALHSPGAAFTLASEFKGEAIGWAVDGKSFFTTSERNNNLDPAAISSYAFAGPQPGDFDADGDVDQDDLAVWQDHYGLDAWADANLDLASDGDDFLAWQRNLDAPAEAPLAAIPEPATAMLLIAAGLTIRAANRQR